ncbi:MAG: hypothetical protein D3923_11980 [Candidatus Electrothrix sp. AR3]|nr:hypothetical protein [Candidatus Electrothrix sp. AR3]
MRTAQLEIEIPPLEGSQGIFSKIQGSFRLHKFANSTICDAGKCRLACFTLDFGEDTSQAPKFIKSV